MTPEDGPTVAPRVAMVLGTRMRPITDTLPKPLVEIGGRTLIDRGLDALAQGGVETAVVNVHHLAHPALGGCARSLPPPRLPWRPG